MNVSSALRHATTFVIIVCLEDGFRQESGGLLKRRDEAIELGEAHAGHRNGDAEARNQISIR